MAGPERDSRLGPGFDSGLVPGLDTGLVMGFGSRLGPGLKLGRAAAPGWVPPASPWALVRRGSLTRVLSSVRALNFGRSPGVVECDAAAKAPMILAALLERVRGAASLAAGLASPPASEGRAAAAKRPLSLLAVIKTVFDVRIW